jgi:hypothetical protein
MPDFLAYAVRLNLKGERQHPFYIPSATAHVSGLNDHAQAPPRTRRRMIPTSEGKALKQ